MNSLFKYIAVLVVLTFATSVTADNSTEKTQIPLENFFKQSDFGYLDINTTDNSLVLSPTGEYLAARVKVKGIYQLSILDVKTKKIIQSYNFGSFGEVGSVGWLNDDRVYAAMHKKVGPLEASRPNGFVFAGNIDGSKKIRLLPTPPRPGRSEGKPMGYRILHNLPSDTKHVLIQLNDGLFPSAFKLNVYNGQLKKIAKSPVKRGTLVADTSGRIAAAFGADELGEVYSLYTRLQGSEDWSLAKEWVEKDFDFKPIGFVNDNKSMYATLKTNDKPFGLYRYNFTDKSTSLIKTLAGDAEVVDYIYDDNHLSPSLVGIVRQPGYLEKTYIDDTSKISQLDKALSNVFKGQYAKIINFDKSSSIALIATWADKNPGTFYLFDTQKNKLQYLLDIKPELDRKKLFETRPFAYKARDGMEIRGYITIPNKPLKDLPLVQYIHGGPYGVSDDWRFDPTTQFLASRGYLVQQVNYRGSGGRGNDFQYDAYRKMGAEMQDDLTDAALWAVEQGYVNKKRICMYGASYGGYAAMMAAVKEPELYKCVIPYVGVYDIAIQKESDTWDSKGGRKFMDEAWGIYDEEFMKLRSPVTYLHKLKSAIYLVHGEKDLRVPIDQYDDLTKRLDKMNYPYKSMVKKHEGHGFREQNNVYELWTELEKFLDEQIGQ